MTVKTNSRQKAIFLIIAVFALFGLAFPANAITSQEIINQITALQAKITALQQQLAQIQGQTTQWCHNFNANLGYGDTNSEVGALLVALEKEGLYEIVDINPVRRFDEMIASAVSGFQQKYASEILTPWRLKYGTGFVGVSTRAKLNKLYGCGLPSTTSLTPIVEYPNGGETLVKGQSYEVRWQHAQVLAGKNVNISVHFVGPGEPYSIGSADRWGKDHLIYGPTTVGITTFVPSKGSISWIVPQSVNDGQYKIYVEEFDPITGENHVDLSDTAFTITAPSVTTSITVLSPNGGEQWRVGNTYQIKWRVSGLDKVKILLESSRDQITYKVLSLASSVNAADGVYSWTIPEKTQINSLQDSPYLYEYPYHKIEVVDDRYDYNSTVSKKYSDESDYDFTIVSPATVTSCNTLGTVMYTNPDGTGYIGCDIKAYGDFVLANSYCQGQTTLRKAYLVPDSYGRANQYFATLTGLNVNEEVKVFIGLKDGSQLECLPSLNKNVPSITVLSPNGGEQWEVGKTYNIVWESSNLTSTDKILVSIVGSGGEQHLAYNLAGNLGTYTWTVPSNFTVGSYKIKVEGCKSTGQCRSDQSDNYFTIVSAGAFSNLSADLQENKASFSFSYSGTTNEFLIDMSILPDMSWGNYVNFTWASQSPVTHNDPQNRWDQYRCGKTLYWRVYSSDRNKQSSIQTATVNCQPAPSITVLSPNGGEVLYENVNYIIKWNTLGLPSTARILLTLLRNDGKNIDIINGLPAAQQEYVWKVTTAGQWQDGLGYKNKPSLLARLLGIQEAKAAGIGYKIMVTASYENGYLASDSSDNYFSINSTGSETRDLIRQADLRQISSAMELYYGDHDAYVTGETMPTAIPPYMAKVYTDPKSNSSYGWVNNTGDDQKFCVYTALETGCASGQIGYFTSSHKGTTTVACAATAPTWTLACP